MTSRPFLTRLILPFAIMMALIVAVCGSVIYFAGKRAVHYQQTRELERLASLVRQWLGGEISGSTPSITPERAEQLRGASELLATRITLIAPDGTVFFDSHADVKTMQNHNQRPEIVAAREGDDAGIALRHSATLNDDAVYVAERLDPDRPDGVIIRLSYPQRYWASLETPVWAIVLGGIASALLAAMVLARVLQRQWVAPVRELADAADQMAAGDWTRRVAPSGAEELRAFSTRLNTVAANAQRQVDQLRAQRADLQSLMDTLPDPLLVIDANQHVVHVNAPAVRLFELTSPRDDDQSLGAIVTDAAILRTFEEFLQKQEQTHQREIHLHREGRRLNFQALATRTTAGGVLLVLRDVSTLSQAVQMKSDFVANASHELRTPIAAIKAAFDTLQEVQHDDPEQVNRCIRIMDGHLRRLEEMLADLLDLSRVERAELEPELTEIQCNTLFAAVHGVLSPLAREKQVSIVQEIDPPALSFTSDERLLHLVLKNLAENSIKFTPVGGRVTLRAERREQHAILTVIDTGIGIPPEHLDRVFERFYQVNPARTGSAGRGTGLGLAIVKHAIAALGGTVHLTSTLGTGTTITCTVPIRGRPCPLAPPPSPLSGQATDGWLLNRDPRRP